MFGSLHKAYIGRHNRYCYSNLNQTCNLGGNEMVNEGRGRLFRRKDGKFLIYLPKDLAEDSMFPFKTAESMYVKITFELGDNKVLIEKYKEPQPEPEPT